MPRLSLTATLGLNKTGFDAGMKAAEKTVERFSASAIRKAGSALLAAFGVNRLVSFGQKVVEQGANIDRLSRRFNLTTDEVQILQRESDRTGQSFESLVSDAEKLEQTLSSLRGGDVIFSRQQVADLADAHEKLKAFNDELSKETAKAIENPVRAFLRVALPFGHKLLPEQRPAPLTERQEDFLEKEAAAKRAAARVVEIERETAKLREQIQKKLLSDEEEMVVLQKKREEIFNRMAKTAVERAQKEKDLAQNELDIVQIQEAMDRKSEKRRPGSSIQESPLGQIGVFTGAQANAGISTGQLAMVSQLQQIHSALVQKGIIIRDVA